MVYFMAKTRGFILSHFSKYFFLIFLPFFGILSIVYLVRLATFSEHISINILDFFAIFYLFLPEILFYTIPISFIIAVTSTFSSLSREDELTALFSFGITPTKLLRLMFTPAILAVTLLLVISVLHIPNNTLKFDIFKSRKKNEAKLVVKPNQIRQKFGKFFMFFNGDDNGTLKDIVLFTKNQKRKILLMAEKGNIEQKDGNFALRLYNGSGNTFLETKTEETYFSAMNIFSSTPSAKYSKKRVWSIEGITQNKREMAWFVYYIFLSFSPLSLMSPLVFFSIQTSRNQTRYPHIISFLSILTIYLFASYLMRNGTAFGGALTIITLLGINLYFIRLLKTRF